MKRRGAHSAGTTCTSSGWPCTTTTTATAASPRRTSTRPPGVQNFSAVTHMLPFLDETAMFNAINFAQGWNRSVNRTARVQKLSQLLWPIRPGRRSRLLQR